MNMNCLEGKVVQGRIELCAGGSLPEGAIVTVQLKNGEGSCSTDPDTEVDQELIGAGLMTFGRAATEPGEFALFEPIKIQGEPISKSILEERR